MRSADSRGGPAGSGKTKGQRPDNAPSISGPPENERRSSRGEGGSEEEGGARKAADGEERPYLTMRALDDLNLHFEEHFGLRPASKGPEGKHEAFEEEEDDRRHRLMNMILLVMGTAALMILIMLMVLDTLGILGPGSDPEVLYMSVVVALFGTIVVFLINYLGFPSLAGSMFLVIILFGIAVSDRPDRVIDGRALFLFAIPILMAGILLRPWASFVMAGLCTLTISVIGTGIGHPPNLPAVGGFFAFAALSWLSGNSLERSIRNLQSSNERLRSSEMRLRKSEDRYHKIMSSSPDSIMVLDSGGTITDCNAAMVRMQGSDSREDLLGRDVLDIISHGRRMKAEGCMNVVRRRGSVRDVVLEFVRADGSSYPVEVSSAVLGQTPGTDQSIICVAKDITERRRMEKERRMMSKRLKTMVERRTSELRHTVNELESLSYSVSHDLRGPLRGIDGFSQLLLEEYGDHIDGEGRKYLGRIKQANANMSSKIDALQHLIMVGRRRLRMRDANMSAFARDAVKDLETREPERNVRVNVRDTPWAMGDPVLLRRMVSILIDNAWKFTRDSGEPQIEFGHRHLEGRRVYYVRDNGAGFDMRYSHKLFMPFQRLHIREGYKGLGTGLAIVRRIMDRHGGSAWAEGRPGGGSTFMFSFDGEAATDGGIAT